MTDCMSFTNEIAKILDAQQRLVRESAKAAPAEQIEKLWEAAAASDRFGVQTRVLDRGKPQHGELLAADDRLYLTQGPAREDTALVLSKSTGNAVLGVRICGIGPNGGHVELGHWDIDASTVDGMSFKLTLPSNHVGVVFLNCRSVLKHVVYTLEQR